MSEVVCSLIWTFFSFTCLIVFQYIYVYLLWYCRGEVTEAPPPLPIDYGPDNGFMMLTEPSTGCLELPHKEYVYSLCAFKNAFQRSTYESGSGTLLGTWKEWRNHPEESVNWTKEMKMTLPYDTMIYNYGAGCWNGPPRSATVRNTF